MNSREPGRNNPDLELIWAPWRMAYIESCDAKGSEAVEFSRLLPGADPACFLCQAVADSERPQRLVVYQNELTIVVLNRYPYNNGHLLVAPRRHVGAFREVTTPEHAALMQTVDRMLSLLQEVMNPDGFNIGLNLGRVAGAGLPGHLHWHVVPRWSGDTNFMPVLANTKVIPQALEALWELLRQKLASPAR
ncbi:MAG: HIT family protein [Thermogutta sp.]